MSEPLRHEQITESIIGVFYEVYNCLGFGFLEHLYVVAMERELIARGHRVLREYGVEIFYKGAPLGRQRLDLVVDEVVVVETKSTYDLHPAARRQLCSYLRGSRIEVGLLLHFGPKPRFYREYFPNALGVSATSGSSD